MLNNFVRVGCIHLAGAGQVDILRNANHKKKGFQIISGTLEFINGSGERIRTSYLRVMSPTSYRTAPPRVTCKQYTILIFIVNRFPASAANKVAAPRPKITPAKVPWYEVLMAICKHWIPACAGTRETRKWPL